MRSCMSATSMLFPLFERQLCYARSMQYLLGYTTAIWKILLMWIVTICTSPVVLPPLQSNPAIKKSESICRAANRQRLTPHC